MTDEERQALAQEVAEAIPAVRKLIAAEREDQVQVIKHLLDKQIGTDETAVFTTIPGLTPAMTEMITDPLLDLAAKAILNLLAPPEG